MRLPATIRLTWFGAACVASAALAAWLWLGIYSDREFSTFHLFTKHRASFQVYFWSPLGESDNTLESLPPERQRAELAFDEFVFHGEGYWRSIKLF